MIRCATEASATPEERKLHDHVILGRVRVSANVVPVLLLETGKNGVAVVQAREYTRVETSRAETSRPGYRRTERGRPFAFVLYISSFCSFVCYCYY